MWSINLAFIHNYRQQKLKIYILKKKKKKTLKFKYLIDDITIRLWFSENFASMKNIRRTCYLMKDFSKFTINKTLLSGVVSIGYNQVCIQTFTLKIMYKIKQIF